MNDVTIVIPTIDERMNLLMRAIDSVETQTHSCDVVIECAQPGEGAWTVRNRGASRVTTQWIAFLDDDDELLPNHIELNRENAIVRNADLVWSWFEIQSNPERKIQAYELFDENRGRQWNAADPFVVPITYLVKTDVLHRAMDKVGGFLPDEEGAWQNQDMPLFAEIADNGQTFADSEITWIWHWHGGNTSGLPRRRALGQEWCNLKPGEERESD